MKLCRTIFWVVLVAGVVFGLLPASAQPIEVSRSEPGKTWDLPLTA